MTTKAKTSALASLEAHDKRDALTDLTDLVASRMATTRRADVFGGQTVRVEAESLSFGSEGAMTPYGDALAVLERGPESPTEHALANALATLWAKRELDRGDGDGQSTIESIVWLAAHSPFDVSSTIEHVFADEAQIDALGARLERFSAGDKPWAPRAEIIVMAGWLLALSGISQAARQHAAHIASGTDDAFLASLLSRASADAAEIVLEGEAEPTPRSAWLTVIQALSGWLALRHVAGLFGRLALSFRRPSRLRLTRDALHVDTRTLCLGRTLRETELVVGREQLDHVIRDVRYPRLAFYVGLTTLAVASYIGMAAFVDGARAASPSLLATGVIIVGIGVGVDFAVRSLLPGLRGRVRLVIVPRVGKRLCIGMLDREAVDDALDRWIAMR